MVNNYKKLSKFFPLAVLTLAAALPPTVHAQSATPSTNPTKPITFEVVSIRPHPAGMALYGPGFTDDGMTLHGQAISGLISSTFNNWHVEGIPADMQHQNYDIAAKVADEDIPAWKKLSRQQRNLAVQAMLADRFKLTLHHETRQLPGFALVVAKGGPLFKEANPDDKYEKGIKALDGVALKGVMFGTSRDTTSGQAVTMKNLAEWLPNAIGSPVLDKTGLTGNYDLTIKFERTPPGPPAGDFSGPSIFTAVQEQLGLKLVPGATVPIEFIVVDHVERPAEN